MPNKELHGSPAARLRLLLEQRGIFSDVRAAEALGIARTTYQKGRQRGHFRHDTYAKIAHHTGLNPEWIEHGAPPTWVDLKAADRSGWGEVARRMMAEEGGEEGRREEVPEPPEAEVPPVAKSQPPAGFLERFFFVPKANARLAAGAGIVAEEGTTGDQYAFRKDWLKLVARDTERLILVDVEGDSMLPTLHDKDTVLIDLTRRAIRTGRIYAIGVDDVVQIKRLEILPGRIRVVSDNQALFKPFEVSPDEIRVLGQMIWFARTVV
jgi:phage repressor protein C with HTH and peptisase S24 domain